MDPEELESKIAELIDRIGEDPATFEFGDDERERVESFLGETIMHLRDRHAYLSEAEPLLGTPNYPLQPAAWALFKVLLGEFSEGEE